MSDSEWQFCETDVGRMATRGDFTLWLGDCLDVAEYICGVQQIITDPPYGETSLKWDARVRWQDTVGQLIAENGSMWVFGSLRHFMETVADFSGWRMAQDVLWEKHNGSSVSDDRFRRVHEHAAHFYRCETPWEQIKKNPLYTNDATARALRRKARPPHLGEIGESTYVSEDGGPKLMRSVMFCRSCHGYARHRTQKPVDVVIPLVEYSTDPGDTVLDPFMGSGTTGVACLQTGRRFIGIDKDPESFEIAIERIDEAISDRRSRLILD